MKADKRNPTYGIHIIFSNEDYRLQFKEASTFFKEASAAASSNPSLLRKAIPKDNRMERAGKTKYQIFIDDNFHYMDEDERIAGDVFDTAEEAIAAAKKIVDKSLRHEYRQHPGLSADELWGYGSAQESIMRIESSNIANELMKSIEGA